jgi:hypothetical protein
MSTAVVISASCDTQVGVSSGTTIDARASRRHSIQGNYLGLTRLANVISNPTEIRLSVELADSGRFAGKLRSLEQSSQNVAGTITSSGQCPVVATHDAVQATVRLDWQNHGGGAAILAGELSQCPHGRRVSGPAALLRPFGSPAIDWNRFSGRFPTTFASAANRQPIEASTELFAGTRGLLQAKIFSLPQRRTAAVVIGATSAGGTLIAVGIDSCSCEIVTLTGSVRAEWDGLPVQLAGHYLIETSTGQLIDLGRFQIQLKR